MPSEEAPMKPKEREALRAERTTRPLLQPEVKKWIEHREYCYGLRPGGVPEVRDATELLPSAVDPAGAKLRYEGYERELWLEGWKSEARAVLDRLLENDGIGSRESNYVGAEYLRLLADMALYLAGANIKRGKGRPGKLHVKFYKPGTGRADSFAKALVNDMLRFLLVHGDWDKGRRPSHVRWEEDELAALWPEYNTTLLGKRFPWKINSTSKTPIKDSVREMEWDYELQRENRQRNGGLIFDATLALRAVVSKHSRDPRLPEPGMAMNATYKGAAYECVERSPFEGRFRLWRDREFVGCFHSLDSAARAATGKKTDGFTFFALSTRRRGRQWPRRIDRRA